MTTLSNLNSFSERVANAIFAKYSEWVRSSKESEDSDGSLVIEVPFASGSDDVLYVLTENDEITIGSSRWHDHYGAWTGASEADALKEALDFLDEFTAEKVVIVAVEKDGLVNRSWTAALGQELDDRDINSGDEIVVQSWRGSHDRTFRVESNDDAAPSGA
jgi:hypothetical protein